MAANDPDGGNVETAIGVVEERGKRFVCLRYMAPVTVILFEAQNAFEIAEGLARAAYEARFGKAPPVEGRAGELLRQVGNRMTKELRDQIVTEQAFNIRSMINQGKDPNTIAQQVVDVILTRLA